MNRREISSDFANTLSPMAVTPPPLRVVFFGLPCDFTRIVVETCARSGVNIVGLLVPGPDDRMAPVEVAQPRTLLPMAGSGPSHVRAPLFHIGRTGSASTRQLVSSLAPDVIAIACYPTRIPPQTAAIARLGALNVHPSRLPAGRGPDPLFWTLRRGDGQAAVTVHALDVQMDAGPIYLQRDLEYPDGTTESELNDLLATAGGALLVETIAGLATNALFPTAQDETRATYQTWPTAGDFVIDTTLSARAAYNFIRGVAGRYVPVTIATPAGDIIVDEALQYVTGEGPAAIDAAETRWVQFADGWLRIRSSIPPVTGIATEPR